MTYLNQLTDLYAVAAPGIVEWLLCRFPGRPRADAEDACSGAFTQAFAGADTFRAAWRRGGPGGLFRLLRQAAWRLLRGRWRAERRRRHLHATFPPLDRAAPSPEHVVEARRGLGRLSDRLEAVVALHGGTTPEALHAALVHRLRSGCTDTAAAARHGVRRESVNRARRALIRGG